MKAGMGVEIPHPPDMCNSVKIENWDGQRDIDNGFPLFFVSSKLAPTTGNSSTSFGLMQEEHQQEPYFLRAKLLEAVDADYNVRDMPLILEVLGKLEVLHVSKEILETTRLGKTVNEFRRKVNDAILARRLKDLVKKWRDAVLDVPQNHFPVNGASSVAPEGGAAGGNRAFPPNFSSKFNSSSLSPRIGAVTNYTNNNNSVHSIPASRNGSSSISNISPNHRNPQLSSSSYATLVSPSASSASPLLNSRSLVSPHKSRSPGGPTLSAFNTIINSNVFPSPSSHFQSTNSSYAPTAENLPSSIPTPAPPAKIIDWGDSDGEEEYNQKRIIEEQAEIISQQVQVIEEEYTVATVGDIEPVTTVVVSSDADVTDITEEIIEDQSSPIPQRVVDEEFVEKYVTEDIPNLNGNHDKDGQFRSWHETLTVESYKSEPLHILPYTIIDF